MFFSKEQPSPLPLQMRIAALFMSPSFLLLACSSPQLSSQPTSRIDAEFQLKKLDGPTTQENSPGVSFYQNVLSQTLASDCKWYPSDSRYAQLVHKRCGPVKAVINSYSRFSLEPDIDHLGLPIFPYGGHLVFKDLPNDCSYF